MARRVLATTLLLVGCASPSAAGGPAAAQPTTPAVAVSAASAVSAAASATTAPTAARPTSAPEPPPALPVAAGASPCVVGTERAFKTFRDVDQRLEPVRPGWSAARLTSQAGDPHDCNGEVWVYTGGPRDGPYASYHVTVQRGVVVNVRRLSVGCVLSF